MIEINDFVTYNGKMYKVLDKIAVTDNEGIRFQLEGLKHLVNYKDLDNSEKDYFVNEVKSVNDKFDLGITDDEIEELYYYCGGQ
jgi:hypothetical protein